MQFPTLDFVAVGPEGYIYVAHYGNHAIRALKPGSEEEPSLSNPLIVELNAFESLRTAVG